MNVGATYSSAQEISWSLLSQSMASAGNEKGNCLMALSSHRGLCGLFLARGFVSGCRGLYLLHFMGLQEHCVWMWKGKRGVTEPQPVMITSPSLRK